MFRINSARRVRSITYCLVAISLLGISCASGEGSGCGGSFSGEPSEAEEALIQKKCLSGGCVGKVAFCFEAATPDLYKRSADLADQRCQWFIDAYSSDHLCYRTCGECSKGSKGHDRMYTMVKTVVGCSPY